MRICLPTSVFFGMIWTWCSKVESAAATAQSRILPLCLSKMAQPMPHKGFRRFLPPVGGKKAAAVSKNSAKNRPLSKTPFRPARDKGCERRSCTTNNAACGIETSRNLPSLMIFSCCTTNNAACGIETIKFCFRFISRFVAPQTMLRAALKPSRLRWKTMLLLLHHKQCCVRH